MKLKYRIALLSLIPMAPWAADVPQTPSVTQVPAAAEKSHDVIGQAAVVKGEVLRLTPQGQKFPLFTKDEVYLGDTIITGRRARAQLILKDDSIYTVGRNSTVKMTRFWYDAETQEGHSSIENEEGILQFVTGKLAKKDPQNVKVKTPFATIGVRGSGGIVQVAEGGATLVGLTQCCLDVSANQSTAPAVPLNTVNEFTEVKSPTEPATAPLPMPAEVQQRLMSAVSVEGDDTAPVEKQPVRQKEQSTPEEKEEGAEPQKEKTSSVDKAVPQKRQEAVKQRALSEKQAVVKQKQPVAIKALQKQRALNAAPPVTENTAPETSLQTLDASIPLTNLSVDTTALETGIDTNVTIVNPNEVNGEEEVSPQKQMIGGQLLLREDGRAYTLTTGFRDAAGNTGSYALRKATGLLNTYDTLPTPQALGDDVRTEADTTVAVPTQAFSAGFVQKRGTGTFYRVKGATAENPHTITTKSETRNGTNMLTGVTLTYKGSTLLGGTGTIIPDTITVAGGSIGGDAAQTLDNRSYAMEANRVVLVNEATDQTTAITGDTHLQSGIISEASLFKLCETCAFTHWGVWAGSFERIDLELGNYNTAELVPYVAGTKTTFPQLDAAINDSREVNYEGHTFGALVNSNGISHHTGDFNLRGTLGSGLDLDANLGDYEMTGSVPSSDPDFTTNLTVTNGSSTGSGITTGAFFGSKAEEVGGQFEFNVDGTAGAGIYQGADALKDD